LKGKLPTLNIFTDYPRPLVQSFEGDRIQFVFDRTLTGKLAQLIKETGTTLFMVLLAVLNILLSKYSGQEDIIVGSTVAGREHIDFEFILGLFFNVLPIRNYPIGSKTFAEFLDEVKENTLIAYDNQGYPFGELIEKLAVPQDISRNPLYDAELIVQNVKFATLEIAGLQFIPQFHEFKETQMDISLEAVEIDETVSFSLTYCTKLFKRETIEMFIDFFKKILLSVFENKEIKLEDIHVSHDLRKAHLTVPRADEIKFGFN
jgi:tyrocidine synthetase-3